MQNTYMEIKKDIQIWKFCLYGFFKNLKFFEPYLLIYLLGMGLSFFHIGLMFSVKEIITYIFEVPSGIIADHYGKKKELLMCFGFYIISFVLFFFANDIYIVLIAMVFFGLGEAFRSGTHKAMILGYLEHKKWYSQKAYVYGRTRSYSLLGSSISSFLSILLVLNLPSLKWIFLICIIPYILDFLLISSYPKYLDEKRETQLDLKTFYLESVKQLKSINKNIILKKILISSAIYDGVFKSIKDYIQPILKVVLISSGMGIIMSLDGDESIKVYLGLIYGFFYICSSLVSKNIYIISNKISSIKLFEKSFDLLGLLLIGLSIFIRMELTLFVIIIYFLIYIFKDGRKPIFVDVCSDYMDKNQRTTVLSIESQIRSLFMVVMAPVFGFLADKYSLSTLFLLIGLLFIGINRLLKIRKN